MNNSRLRLILAAAALFSPTLGLADTQCPTRGNDGQFHTVEEGLEWCSRDHGFNEGATCGLNALGGTGISGLPQIAAQAILGNTWDRTNMMGATRVAFQAGQHERAIDAAICCQIHNPHMSQCLGSNRLAIANWLQKKTEVGTIQSSQPAALPAGCQTMFARGTPMTPCNCGGPPPGMTIGTPQPNACCASGYMVAAYCPSPCPGIHGTQVWCQ
jgi:hypothetical protein